MSFISIYFVLFVLLINFIYYCIPLRFRHTALAGASLVFCIIGSSAAVLWLLFSALAAYCYGIGAARKIAFFKSRSGLCLTIILIIAPLILLKYWNFFGELWHGSKPTVFSDMLLPVGISFYTLTLISYTVDIYKENYQPEKRFERFFLFAAFFPQILQGPIARYDKISETLFAGHKFSYREFTFGWQMILWGYFLKFVIADKAGIMINTVYGDAAQLQGIYIVAAAILYSIQLYADFMGCVNIALGAAQTFGIRLQHNFRQPYFATSIREFWRRWHITLSNWLRDYIYIPLGGSRKGIARQCINIVVVFGISGLWHGTGLTFICWGLLHGIYQILEILFSNIRKDKNIRKKSDTVGRGRFLGKAVKTGITFLLVTFAWMLFRAESMEHFISLISNMFACFNPEAILDGDAYYKMGLSRIQTLPLIFGIACMAAADLCHEKGRSIREWVAERPLGIRWMIYLSAIAFVLIFGTYGPAYAGNQFIYGQF